MTSLPATSLNHTQKELRLLIIGYLIFGSKVLITLVFHSIILLIPQSLCTCNMKPKLYKNAIDYVPGNPAGPAGPDTPGSP